MLDQIKSARVLPNGDEFVVEVELLDSSKITLYPQEGGRFSEGHERGKLFASQHGDKLVLFAGRRTAHYNAETGERILQNG
jgi:hypothetical protein